MTAGKNNVQDIIKQENWMCKIFKSENDAVLANEIPPLMLLYLVQHCYICLNYYIKLLPVQQYT